MTNYQLTLLALAVEQNLDLEAVPPVRRQALQELVDNGCLDPEWKPTTFGLATYRAYTEGE
jgi:hypothetical protein